MPNEPIILDGSNPDREKRFVKCKMSKTAFKKALSKVSLQQQAKYKVWERAALIGEGIKVGTVGVAFISKEASALWYRNEESDPGIKHHIEPVALPEHPAMATNIQQEMSFDKAFIAARHELGAGGYFKWHGHLYNTYYKEEWAQLSREEQQEFAHHITDHEDSHPVMENTVYEPVVVHEVAPVTLIGDHLTFNDAHALARSEVGSGGIFIWRGNHFSTYTKEEFSNLPDDDKAAYNHSITEANIDSHSVTFPDVSNSAIVEPNPETSTDSADEPNNNFIASQEIQGTKVDIYEQHGQIVGKMDIGGKGQYDYEYNQDTNHITNLSTGQSATIDQLKGGNSHGDTGDSVPIETQEVTVDGHQAMITTFSDGHQEANVDLDGDGHYDSLVTVDNSGYLHVFNDGGVLIHSDSLNMDANETADPVNAIHVGIIDPQDSSDDSDCNDDSDETASNHNSGEAGTGSNSEHSDAEHDSEEIEPEHEFHEPFSGHEPEPVNPDQDLNDPDLHHDFDDANDHPDPNILMYIHDSDDINLFHDIDGFSTQHNDPDDAQDHQDPSDLNPQDFDQLSSGPDFNDLDTGHDFNDPNFNHLNFDDNGDDHDFS